MDPNTVVARVNGIEITAGDLQKEVGGFIIKLKTDMANKEYAYKKQALDRMIDNKLLEAEAKKEGKSVEELLAEKVEAGIQEPSEEDLKRLFAQSRRRLRPGTTFEDVKEDLAKMYKARQTASAKEDYVKSLRKAAKVETMLPFPDLPAVDVSADDDPRKGSPDAPVTIIEFSDFQCPYCKKNVPVLKQLEEEYGDKISIVFRDFPLPFHDKAQKAAEAAECAHEQGKFWEYHDRLFSAQNKLAVDDLKAAAADLGLDTDKFNKCLDSGKYADEVKKDQEDGQKVGVTGTPAAFINGKLVNGARPIDNFKAIIDAELAKKGM